MVKFILPLQLLLSGFTLLAQTAGQINWPTGYEPSQSKFCVHNEIEIIAPPQVVWDILLQAEQWPDWYEGASGVRILDSGTGMLQANSRFQWKTMGLDLVSRKFG